MRYLIILLLLSGTVFAQPVNDRCESTLPLSLAPVYGTTSGAANDYNPIGCGTGYTSEDVVYFCKFSTNMGTLCKSTLFVK